MNRFFFLFLLIISNYAYSQNSQVDQILNVRNMVPPSPNATALGRFDEIPVSNSTGVPDISISLFELTSGKINIPISLKYHSGGFKVNENASWVGLGWALNSGGIISRTRVGYADENNKGYLNSSQYLGSLTFPINYTMNTSQYSVYESLAYGNFDTEPDIFNFSFLGRSGRFFLDAQGNVHQLNYTDLKISVNAAFTEWSIVDEAGTTYTFAKLGYTNVISPYDPYSDYVSSWGLTKIKSVDNQIINFNYATQVISGGTALNVGFSQVVYKPKSENNRCNINLYGGTRYSASQSPDLILGSIESNGFILKFNQSSTSRSDGGVALDNIELYNKPGNLLVKKFTFQYGYFESGGCSAEGLGHEHNNPVLKSRLKLTGIKSVSGVNQQAHSFFYNESISLPYKCSYAQDHWGYYNGKNNASLVPTVEGYPISPADANKESDPLYAQAAILNKIVYPTGGSTVYEFESNKVLSTIRIPQLLSVSDGLYNAPGGTVSIRDFSVGDVNDATITLQLSEKGYPSGNIPPQIIIMKIDGTVVYHYMNSGSYNLLPIQLEAGNYRLKLISPDVPESIVSASIQYTGYQVQNGLRVVGGLRVKSITKYNSNGVNLALKRSYTYENGYLANDFSSNDSYKTNIVLSEQGLCDTGPFLRCDFLGKASYANFAIGSIGGGHLIYRNVTEINSGNGKIIFEYSVFPSSVPQGFPQAPSSLNDWKSGSLLSKSIYNESSRIISKDIFEYDYVEKFNLVNSKLGFVYDSYCHSAAQGQGRQYDEISAINFENLSGLVRQKTNKTTTYHNGGLDSAQLVTNYFYDNNAYTHPSRIEVTDSKGEVTKITRKYPADILSGLSTIASSAKSTLLTQNRINELLEEEKSVGGRFVSKLRVNYSNQWLNSTLTLRNSVETQNSGSILESRMLVHDYDDTGNVLSSGLANGSFTSYRWGYNKQYPIVEVKNAGHQEFYFQNFEEAAVDYDGGLARSTARKYTGSYAGLLNNTGTAEIYGHSSQYVNIVPGKARMFSYSGWIYSESPSAQLFLFMYKAGEAGYYSYVSSVQTTQVGKWVYVTMDALVPADVVKMRLRLDNNGLGKVYFDDLRIRPMESDMSTFTFRPLVGMTSKTDNKGATTFYEYDEFMRLKAVKNQNQQIIQTTNYNLKN